MMTQAESRNTDFGIYEVIVTEHALRKHIHMGAERQFIKQRSLRNNAWNLFI